MLFLCLKPSIFFYLTFLEIFMLFGVLFIKNLTIILNYTTNFNDILLLLRTSQRNNLFFWYQNFLARKFKILCNLFFVFQHFSLKTNPFVMVLNMLFCPNWFIFFIFIFFMFNSDCLTSNFRGIRLRVVLRESSHIWFFRNLVIR